MIVALTTTNKILLGGMGAILIVFALASAFLIPRYRPDFPGRRLGLFVVVCIALFVAMMAAVEFFAVEEEEAEAHGGTVTEVTSGTTETSGDETTQPSEGGAHEIDVSATEFKFDLGEQVDGPGEYAFNLTNKGQVAHDLVVEGPGVDDEKTPVIDPGKSAELDVNLKSGEYVLYCSVPGHRDAGMETKLDVK